MIKVHTSLNEDHLEEIENVPYDLYPHNWSILYENQTKIYKLTAISRIFPKLN